MAIRALHGILGIRFGYYLLERMIDESDYMRLVREIPSVVYLYLGRFLCMENKHE